MPIYEYACTRCEKEFEELIVRSSDEAAVKWSRLRRSETWRAELAPRVHPRRAERRGRSAACGPVG